MSGDELLVLAACVAVALITWVLWFRDSLSVAPLLSKPGDRWLLNAVPPGCALVVYFVLRRLASADVREDWVYVAFYLIMGAAWTGVVTRLLPLFGLSSRDDVVERRNPAAALAIAGALVAFTLCFSGGNIGDGPGWWVVTFAGLLSTGTLLFLWFCLDRMTRLADVVTIDRDRAAGLRLAGFFIGAGFILGRAVAGNWYSVEATLRDFVNSGWPVLPLLGLAAFLEKQSTPALERTRGSLLAHGLVPFAIYLAVGIAVVILNGWWD